MTKLLIYIDLVWNTLSWVSARQSLFIWLSAILMAFTRVFKMLSFFLPIKIIILLSSDIQPYYMNFLPSALSYDAWLIVLIICVPIFYLFSMLSSLYSFRFEKKALADVKEDTQHYNAKEAVRLIKVKIPFLNGILVLGIGLLALFLMSWVFFLSVLVFLFFLAFIMEYVLFKDPAKATVSIFNLTRSQFIDFFSGSSYILIVGILAILVITGDLEIFSAILSLLITRLIVGVLQKFLNDWAKNYEPLKHLKKK